jgi:hypothetical protein
MRERIKVGQTVAVAVLFILESDFKDAISRKIMLDLVKVNSLA